MDNQHAIDNAKGWLVSIRAMVAVYDDITEEDDYTKPDPQEARDKAEQAIFESALLVLVRSGWYDPATATSAHESSPPAEYEILLTTGGPGLRIVGELSGRARTPETAKLQWQDWGVPWTDFHMADLPEGMTPSEADTFLLSYASHFYFGE